MVTTHLVNRANSILRNLEGPKNTDFLPLSIGGLRTISYSFVKKGLLECRKTMIKRLRFELCTKGDETPFDKKECSERAPTSRNNMNLQFPLPQSLRCSSSAEMDFPSNSPAFSAAPFQLAAQRIPSRPVGFRTQTSTPNGAHTKQNVFRHPFS